MKSKKIIAISLIAAIMLGLTACGSDETSAPVEASTETSVTSESDVEAEVAVNQDESTGDTTVEENTTKAVETTTTQVNSGSVNPDDFWEGDTFHLDEYAEALGYTIKPSSMLHRYGDGNTKVLIVPAAEKIEFWEYEETIFEAKYGNHDYQYLREGNINIEFNDIIIGKNESRLGEYIETLQWFSNTDNPYSFEEALPYWHK